MLKFVTWIALSALVVACSSKPSKTLTNDVLESKHKVEYAVSACETADAVLNRLDMNSVPRKKKYVIYFDTEDKTLLEKGLILRLRYSDKKGDLTVKIRPSDHSKIDTTWLAKKGTKCEWDVNRTKTTPSCSEKKKLKGAGLGKNKKDNKILKLLSPSQIKFAESVLDKPLSDHKLIAYGPARIYKWEQKWHESELEVQEWTFITKEKFTEISFRVKPNQFNAHYAHLQDKIVRSRIRLCEKDQAKTKRLIK